MHRMTNEVHGHDQHENCNNFAIPPLRTHVKNHYSPMNIFVDIRQISVRENNEQTVMHFK